MRAVAGSRPAPIAHSRTTRGSSSPVIGKMLLPSQGTPMSLTASSMNGSNSSTTISRSTDPANRRIRLSGKGHVMPNFRIEAVGKTSLAY